MFYQGDCRPIIFYDLVGLASRTMAQNVPLRMLQRHATVHVTTQVQGLSYNAIPPNAGAFVDSNDEFEKAHSAYEYLYHKRHWAANHIRMHVTPP
jgi:hypothetical protein